MTAASLYIRIAVSKEAIDYMEHVRVLFAQFPECAFELSQFVERAAKAGLLLEFDDVLAAGAGEPVLIGQPGQCLRDLVAAARAGDVDMKLIRKLFHEALPDG